MSKYDIIVVGGGPGGYVAAIRAAQLGAKVALIEKDKVGGTCLNRGCIPTKAIIACTNLFEKIQGADNFGITTGPPSIDLKKVIGRKNLIVEKIVKGVEFLLEKNKVEVIRGTAEVLGSGKVEIEAQGQRQEAEGQRIILATGSSPARLPGIEFDGNKFLSSAQALDLTEIPKQINIIGGGVIGVEFATIFSALGSEVTIYEALSEILAGVDAEIVALIKRILRRRKVKILTNSKFDTSKAVEKNLICVGRVPNSAGLENIKVNNKMETSLPGIYAVGDLVSKKMLAHAAYEQGEIAAENALGNNRTFNDEFVPSAIFTSPEIACIGRVKDAKTGKFPYAALGIAQAKGEIEGFIKVVSDSSNRITGVHIIGPDATNLIGTAALALRNGFTTDELAKTFQAHPSFPEGLQEAALSALKRSIHQIN
ncbi:MAG: dihydrolipoyl dehydrogenase [Candidatus Margulisbacteria bacterium]|nr:dihydrolipoyl dehydrogenase [Candidatus Margulisiibacteriota bacterium]